MESRYKTHKEHATYNKHNPTRPYLRNNSHKLHDRPSELAYCRSPNQAVTNQQVIIVIQGEISSVECCLWSERTSLGTINIGLTA